jgi:hypothetical protein
VPPPAKNIVLTLKCPGLKRSKTHVHLKFTTTRKMTAVIATVTGKSPAGSITFSGPGVSGVSLPVGSRSHPTIFVLPQPHERITARYLGDAHNAPSAASGHAG